MKPKYYYTGDLHLGHANILKYESNRYKFWQNTREMNEGLIDNWNKTVHGKDIVVHVGDFTFHHKLEFVKDKYISKLKGNIIFVKGNHDYWIKDDKYIYHHTVEGQFIAASHYPMISWNRSIHGSWNLHGHSHGHLQPLKNQLDVGIDNAYLLVDEYRPLSFDEIKEIIRGR